MKFEELGCNQSSKGHVPRRQWRGRVNKLEFHHVRSGFQQVIRIVFLIKTVLKPEPTVLNLMIKVKGNPHSDTKLYPSIKASYV